jgi:pteridine reductase
MGGVNDRALSGKTALVTGAAVRVGRAIALRLAEAGADVALHYRGSAREAEEAAARVRGLGRRAVVLQGDLALPEDCRRVVREALAGLAGLDLLVHSASTFHRASLEETDESLWDSAMNVNARAGYLLAREAAPALRARRGRVVLISDFLALDPAKNYLAHSVSKAAVEGLVRALAVELAPEVCVNGVAPGTVLPPEGTTAEEAERLARRVPLRRNGEPEDVAGTILFLCAGPSFLTGQVIRVDGGKSIV